ncbi:hypothetical protein BJ742DRAFT_806726 [Cladochytrium replicatum]|nr:hypothetical protein BJ742DRAFT_806726 [Cladochytrium replicatum]
MLKNRVVVGLVMILLMLHVSGMPQQPSRAGNRKEIIDGDEETGKATKAGQDMKGDNGGEYCGNGSACKQEGSSSNTDGKEKNNSSYGGSSPTKKGIWGLCNDRSECESDCCTGDYSNGVPKCAPAGSCSYGSGSGSRKGDWNFCETDEECSSGCCSGLYSEGVLKCVPAGDCPN